MASPNCTNTDISGIGVRSATYAQNLLSFVPAAVALFNDGKISNNEREFIKDQSTNILLTAFGLLLSAIIQAETNQGLDNYHLALVLNLSWMNNTNTFIYFILFLHRKIWSSSPGKWSWSAFVFHLFHRSPTPALKFGPKDIEMAGKSLQQQNEEPESLLDSAVWIGSLHLSLMGGVGIWLWSNPVSFGTSLSCPPNATISVLGRSYSVASPGLQVISLILYASVLIPIVNLILPTALIFIPYFIGSLGRWSNPKKQESVAVWCVALGLILLFAINIIFIVDTEMAISRNESRQADQDTIWTLGQTLAILLLVLPIRGLFGYLLTTTSLVLPFIGETEWGRAVRAFRKCDSKVPWSDIYRWRWLLGDTPVKVDGRAWLLRAYKESQLDGMVHFLCENGADMYVVLEAAATQGDVEIVCSYFTHDMDIRVNHLLDLAAENGHCKIVCFLVEKGADVNSSDGQCLWKASKNGHSDIVKFLVKKGADVNSSGGLSLYVALKNGHSKIAHFLVAEGMNINSSNISYLKNTTANGNFKSVCFLFENGADIVNLGSLCLHTASEYGHLNIVCFLVEKGADVNSSDGQSLWKASKNGHLNIVNFLVEKGADVNSSGGQPLVFAARNGHLKIIHFLVEKGADINSSGGLPLCTASEAGHLEIVRFLVEKGADVNGSGQNMTPLDLAVKHKHPEIVTFLHNNGGVQTSSQIHEILSAIQHFPKKLY